jgi:hypothetical protein
MSARGIRNNNPGNIREGAGDRTVWFGERVTDDDPDFEEFTTPEAGIRAMVKVLRNYQSKYGLRNACEIINRWAPAKDHNNTTAYIKAVCDDMGVGQDDYLDLWDYSTIRSLVVAIIQHENGSMPYSDAVIAEGIMAA